ncbi:PREDICTED: NKG2-D type II integral membrane protein-like [Cyprinodon variegatus]|uniref:NKG2-D type II integral membrane protein-like n=1 Tax=Cyprinodon variegatus TaxID=28743 RepID=UPI000742CC1A|nr:PREDICTED: NKG2-D type II integral membrane protein-like [Cyprinodon variegatus]
MAEGQVTYAVVKFKRHEARGDATSNDETYSTVSSSQMEKPVFTRNPVEVQQTGQSRRSKVISKRIVLLVLLAVLAATVIFLAVKIKPWKIDTATSESKNETCLKCEAGWELYRGNCYDFSNTTSTWNESRDSCIDLEGDLVKIDSREEQV